MKVKLYYSDGILYRLEPNKVYIWTQKGLQDTDLDVDQFLFSIHSGFINDHLLKHKIHLLEVNISGCGNPIEKDKLQKELDYFKDMYRYAASIFYPEKLI